MYKEKVIKHFGSQRRLAQSLNITRSSVSQWGAVIPEKQALRIEKLTRGILKYDAKLYSR